MKRDFFSSHSETDPGESLHGVSGRKVTGGKTALLPVVVRQGERRRKSEAPGTYVPYGNGQTNQGERVAGRVGEVFENPGHSFKRGEGGEDHEDSVGLWSVRIKFVSELHFPSWSRCCFLVVPKM